MAKQDLPIGHYSNVQKSAQGSLSLTVPCSLGNLELFPFPLNKDNS
jgi:hypothetical protein